MWGDGAAARSQSCLSFDVAELLVELQPSQTTSEPRRINSTRLLFLQRFRISTTSTILQRNSSAIMEFGRAGVLNEGTIAALCPAFCR